MDRFQTLWYANSQGTYIMEEVPDVVVLLLAMAREGDIVQRGFRV